MKNQQIKYILTKQRAELIPNVLTTPYVGNMGVGKIFFRGGQKW